MTPLGFDINREKKNFAYIRHIEKEKKLELIQRPKNAQKQFLHFRHQNIC